MRIGIFGTGAYGLALSSILTENNCHITMWTKFEEEKEQLEQTRKNEKLIPNYILSEKIELTTDIIECIKEKDLLIIAIPVAFIDSLCQKLKPYIKKNHIVIASKGIEQNTNLYVYEILKKYLDTDNIAALSGPTFAVDIPTKDPIALTVASKSQETISLIKNAFVNNYTQIEETEDIIGVEICGAIKNIFAIALGMLKGLECNESTKAMFLTNALNEIKNLIRLLGGEERTILTFAGVGDFILTCTSEKSRNFSYGKLLATTSKEQSEEYLKNTTVEGVYTLKSICSIMQKKNIEMPIISTINDIINGKKKITDILKNTP